MVKRYSLRSATSSVRSLNHILFSSVRVCVYLPTCHIGFLISFLSWQQFTAKCLLMTGTKYPRKRRQPFFATFWHTSNPRLTYAQKKYTLLDPLLSILLSGRANYRDSTRCGSIFYSSEEVSGLTKYNHSQIRTMQMSNCFVSLQTECFGCAAQCTVLIKKNNKKAVSVLSGPRWRCERIVTDTCARMRMSCVKRVDEWRPAGVWSVEEAHLLAYKTDCNAMFFMKAGLFLMWNLNAICLNGAEFMYKANEIRYLNCDMTQCVQAVRP